MRQCNKILLTAAAFTGLGFVNPAASNAQQRYQPSRPTVSPYLNLFRENNGVIPNYQSLVRPMLEQNELNKYQNQTLQQQARHLQELQAGQQSLLEGAAGPSISQTGKGGTYQNLGSHSTYQNTSRYFRNR